MSATIPSTPVAHVMSTSRNPLAELAADIGEQPRPPRAHIDTARLLYRVASPGSMVTILSIRHAAHGGPFIS